MESILKEMRSYNAEHKILTSENEVIDRLLKYPVEMQAIYDEFAGKLSENQQKYLWDALLGAATFWNPKVSKALRENKKRLAKLNDDIAKYAQKLAALIQERHDICETSGISAYEDYDFLDWVHRAAEFNLLYQSHVKKDLQALSYRFDAKYWPENFEVVAAIGEYAKEAELYENNAWTEELLSSPKHSNADYLRVILKAIEDRKKYGPLGYILPKEFRISDNTLASLINCTLDLAPESMLSAEYVKRSRQNIRERKLAI